MPMYEYQCLKCEKHFEELQKFSDDPLTECRECGGELRKLITNTSFVLKGTGWYVTDYPSDDRKKAMDTGKSSGAKADKKSDSKKDSGTSATKKTAVNA